MDIDEAIAALGLEGDGINQEVGVRHPGLLPEGYTSSNTKEIRTVEFNLPEVTVVFKGGPPLSSSSSNDVQPTGSVVCVLDYKDLTPLVRDVKEEKNPLKKQPTEAMARLPPRNNDEVFLTWMHLAVKRICGELICNTSYDPSAFIEVVDVSTSPGNPIVQCRAKKSIPTGDLNIFPFGNVVLAETAASHEKDRDKVEKTLSKVPKCYP